MKHTEMSKEKLEKLLHYANRPLTSFAQYDFDTNCEPDSVSTPDSDGDVLWSTTTQELMLGAFPVRVLIKDGVSCKEARRGLKKIRKLLKGEGVLSCPKPTTHEEEIPF